MKRLAIVIAVGAAALLGGSAAHAADNTVKAQASPDVTQSTDMSSRGRHYRHHRAHRHWRHGHYRPYYNSYGYAPRPYYYGGGGPVVTFGFGGGGYRGGGWGRHYRRW
jgi:hypothetical protein